MDFASLDELYNLFNDNNITVKSKDGGEDSNGRDKLLLDDNDISKDLTIKDPIRMYLKEVGQIKHLAMEEELELAYKILAGVEMTKTTLKEANLCLITNIPKRYVGS